MGKKNIILVLIAGMILLLCSCAAKGELQYGNIEEAFADEKEETKGLSLFEKQDDLGLSYAYYPMNLLGLEIEVPDGWVFETENAKHFVISNDSYSVQIMASFENTGDDIVLLYEAEKFFDEDLKAFSYPLDGQLVHEVYRQSPSFVYSNRALLKDTEYSVIEYERLYLENEKARTYESKAIAVHINFRYQNAFITVRSLVKPEDKEYITSLMLRMISGIRECKSTSTLKECVINNIRLRLPEDFYISQNSLKAAICPSKSNSQFAGIMLCVLDNKPEIDLYALRENILNKALPSSKYSFIISMPSPSERLLINGKDAMFSCFSAYYEAKNYEAGDLLGRSGNIIAFCYTYDSKLITLILPEYQIDQAVYLDELIQAFAK